MRVLVVNNETDKDDYGWLPELKKNVLEVAEAEFIVKHFTEVSSKTVDEYLIDYVILSGRVNSPWGGINEWPLFQGEYDLIKKCEVPLLGICAGAQLIGMAYGAKMDYICLDEKEKVNEMGYMEVRLLHNDKIFQGLNSSLIVYHCHYCELKEMPNGFLHLAETNLTFIQGIKHQSREVYGFQFHPERYNEEFQDGKVILQNFFSIKP